MVVEAKTKKKRKLKKKKTKKAEAIEISSQLGERDLREWFE